MCKFHILKYKIDEESDDPPSSSDTFRLAVIRTEQLHTPDSQNTDSESTSALFSVQHLYHKKCIEPWLLEHPTCPMCKFHILKYKIDEESDDPPSSSDTFRLAVIRTEQLHTPDSQNTDTLGRPSDSEPEIQTQHIYENLAFEEEAERMKHQDINSQD
ncbi:E3 ubiquitin-protein ligase RNF128-like [Sinocyclocheilus grahami]|uniref:E3 ubiquitin-protein ligase RNF128-like n=1 Tax=Sinocyclocheilus grahami TaxID=75366 RepID=UPI0007AC7457|nr:PREDICTED: E3 ubiquitin-protein ligase RNF128-like [Sinocyclocheilus grahami]